MMKQLKYFGALALALSLAACSNTTTTTETTTEETTEEAADAAVTEETKTEETADTNTEADVNGTYSIHVDGQDWGAAVTKALVALDASIDEVSTDTFKVTETKQVTDYSDENFPVEETTLDREVTAAYLCDAEGNEVEGPSEYVMLELGYDPDTGSPLLYTVQTGYNTWSSPYYLTITVNEDAKLTSEGVEIATVNIDTEYTSRTTSADSFEVASFTATDDTTYAYAIFEPEEPSENLFVFLHGMGEGGADVNGDLTDPYVTLLANEAANLASSEFQEKVGNATILVPQSPTYWMDATGDASNYDDGIDADGSSYYLESLHELINSVRDEKGATKVVIAGASNGGYMTMLLALTYGDEYQGYIPICEPYTDSLIDDLQIESLKDIPMYFIWADSDTTVDPTLNEIPTVERLKAVDADLQVAEFEKVMDTSGTYTDEEGNPYEYSGHWSWIYFFNDEAVSEDGINSWDWIRSIFDGTHVK